MTGKLLLAAALLALFAPVQGAPAAAAPADRTDAAVARKIAEKEELARIRELEQQRMEVLARIQKRRAELLQNNPKLTKMYLDLLKKIRELALELDSDADIRKLNEERSDVEQKLRKIRQDREQRNQQPGEQKNGSLRKNN